MTDFNQSVLDDIKATVEQYIKIHKRMPTVISVTDYEYNEVYKARQLGVKITVNFQGKEVSPCVVKAYRGEQYDKRYQIHETNKTANGQPYGNY